MHSINVNIAIMSSCKSDCKLLKIAEPLEKVAERVKIDDVGLRCSLQMIYFFLYTNNQIITKSPRDSEAMVRNMTSIENLTKHSAQTMNPAHAK